MRDAHAIERPIKIGRPVVEEIDELRKIRRDIVVLSCMGFGRKLTTWA